MTFCQHLFLPVLFHFSHLGGCILVSWEIDGETLETVADFIFGGSKIIADSNAAMKLKDTPWKKGYDQPR